MPLRDDPGASRKYADRDRENGSDRQRASSTRCIQQEGGERVARTVERHIASARQRTEGRWPRQACDYNGAGQSRTRDHNEIDGRRLDRHGDDHAQPSSYTKRRRSRSPGFARDREHEKAAYNRQHEIVRTGSAPRSPLLASSADPDFAPSGLLAKESNSRNGVTLKYFEPSEARKPKKKWRLYVFKDGAEVDMLHFARQSCYLFGRDQAVADVPIDHASISKQHAVLQYRGLTERDDFGDEKRLVKPYLIDLDSANGCLVNGKEIPASRYYEVRNGDTFRFGACQRDYVLLAEEA